MTDQPKSKLRFEFNRAATEANNLPTLKGSYSHAVEGAPKIEAAFWTGASDNSQHGRGKLTFANVSDSVAALAAAKANPPELPRGIDIKVGEVVIFKDPKGKGKNGEAHWYGYAHEGAQITRIDAYEHGNVLLGGVKPWRPKAAEATPASDAPEVV